MDNKPPYHEENLEAKYIEILRHNLDTFVNSDFTRAGSVNDKSPEWIEIKDNPELPRLLVEVAEEFLSGSRIDRISRIILFVADSIDGYQTFERPELQEFRNKIAIYLVSEIDNLIINHKFSIIQLFKDPHLRPLIHFIVGMGFYMDLEENSPQLIEELRRIAKEIH